MALTLTRDPQGRRSVCVSCRPPRRAPFLFGPLAAWEASDRISQRLHETHAHTLPPSSWNIGRAAEIRAASPEARRRPREKQPVPSEETLGRPVRCYSARRFMSLSARTCSPRGPVSFIPSNNTAGNKLEGATFVHRETSEEREKRGLRLFFF